MMEQIKLYLFVLSIIYSIRFLVEFGLRLTQENPEQMKLSKVEDSLLLFSLSYIITYFLI
jgi:hypothetical protein